MAELTGLNVNVTNTDPLFSQAAPSPEFIIVDEESASTYPLLTPSPTTHRSFDHPLALENNQVLAYERQLSPSSIDTELSSLPAIGTAITPSDFTALNAPSTPDKSSGNKGDLLQGHALTTRNSLQSGMGSSSSSSSVLQDTAASAQLLNSHHYHNLAGDVNCQENGGMKPTLCGLQLGVRKSPQDFYFVSWNWPLIRKFCLWGVMSMMVACVCIVIAYITTLPARCDPARSWYQGSLMYEIFPASFKDSNNDGVGDIRGITSKIDYLRKLGVQSIRLNSIFPSKDYPEHFNNVENLTSIAHTLGTFDDFRTLVKKLHANNISIILDIPLYPFFKELNPKEDPSSSTSDKKIDSTQIIVPVIVNNHILNNQSKTNLNFQPEIKHSWNDNRGVITKVLQFWLHHNVDGFYMRNLENYILDDNFIEQITEWRNTLHSFKDGFDKILICSSKVIDELDTLSVISTNKERRLSTVLAHFSLIDVYIEDIKQIPKVLYRIQRRIILSDPGNPWPLWSTGGVDTPRLASRLQSSNETLAAVTIQMMLPGTPSIFYGDELGLDNIDDTHKERSDINHTHCLAPMNWTMSEGSGKSFTNSRIFPWMSQAVVHGPITGPDVISKLSSIRDNNPSIYMHAIWKERKLTGNSAIRYNDDNILLLERAYPRRNTFVIIANIGRKLSINDLSSIFYGGKVVLDHNGNSGYYIKFHKIILKPGEFYLLKLDK